MADRRIDAARQRHLHRDDAGFLPDGTTVFGTGTNSVAPASAQLTLTVQLSQLTLESTAAGNGLEFAPLAAMGNGGGNWLHFDPGPGHRTCRRAPRS